MSDSHGADVGFASLKIEDGCRAVLGFIVFRGFRGQSYASEIVQTMSDWCLSQVGIFRVYALCDIENHVSMRAMEKAGFSREGILRRWGILPNIDSDPRDVVSFSKLKEPNQALKPTAPSGRGSPCTFGEGRMTTLHQATGAEFQMYREFARSDHGPDAATRQDIDRLLPDGLSTKNQHLLAIRATGGAQVGFLWFTVVERKSGPEAFLLDFVIFSPFRRAGHGKEGMAQLERFVASLGLATISLSVSAHNQVALTLYKGLSYSPVFTRMTKKIKEPNEAREPTAPSGRGSS